MRGSGVLHSHSTEEMHWNVKVLYYTVVSRIQFLRLQIQRDSVLCNPPKNKSSTYHLSIITIITFS